MSTHFGEICVENMSTSEAHEPELLPADDISAQNPPVEASKWRILRQNCAGIVDYLLDSEVHTFAFSVAANAILSFIPFVILLYALAKSVFHSPAMLDVVSDAVPAFFPSTASDKFWGRLETVVPRHLKLLSLLMILISCTGIFLPLEVALNKAWGVAKSRNYIMNQLVSFGLAILMVVLGMGSIMLSTGQRQVLTFLMFGHNKNWFYDGISSIWMLLCTGIACILFFFAIYWVLPNCKVPLRPVLKTSIITGIVWLVAKYIFSAALPHLDLERLYGPFYISVGLLFWAYISGLILFAGAQFSVTPRPEKTKP
jgi:YihY family inner membrane protein